jgi:hypothetical protein
LVPEYFLLSFDVVMASPFKILELAYVSSIILVCQPFLYGQILVAAAATSTPPGHSSEISASASLNAPVTATPSSNVVSTSTNPGLSTVNESIYGLPTDSITFIPAAPPGKLPSSYPQNLTITSGANFDPTWQDCEESGSTRVTISDLRFSFPQFTRHPRSSKHNFSLGNKYAGYVPAGRFGHPNNTLFFWGFENRVGSRTAPTGDIQSSPWLIWLGGGGGYEILLLWGWVAYPDS